MSINALVRFLKPRETEFFDLLDAAAENALAAARAFEAGVRDGDGHTWVELRRAIKDLEHRGDELTRTLMDRLNHTFVTPIDREDIMALSHGIDDIVDDLDAVAGRLALYEIKGTRPAFREIASATVEAAEHLVKLIAALRSMNEPKAIYARIHEVNTLENKVDAMFHVALSELFRDIKDPIEVIKWKEILDTQESALDCIDRAAKMVGACVMRNA